MRDFFAQVSANELDVPKASLERGSVDTIFQIVFAISAGVAVVMLLLAALKYITSQGDPAGVAKAKNSIIYAAIGLVVTAAAFSIVSFVVRTV